MNIKCQKNIVILLKKNYYWFILTISLCIVCYFVRGIAIKILGIFTPSPLYASFVRYFHSQWAIHVTFTYPILFTFSTLLFFPVFFFLYFIMKIHLRFVFFCLKNSFSISDSISSNKLTALCFLPSPFRTPTAGLQFIFSIYIFHSFYIFIHVHLIVCSIDLPFISLILYSATCSSKPLRLLIENLEYFPGLFSLVKTRTPWFSLFWHYETALLSI